MIWRKDMAYDFDTVYDRKNTNSLKWDFAFERHHSEDELPLWVADMDFKTPPQVIDAIKDAAEIGFFGYTEPKPLDKKLVSDWYKRRHGFYPDPECIIFTPGTVFGITTALLAFSKPGDAIMISQPVYYPFSEAVLDNGRKLISHELTKDDKGRYTYDFDSFEKLIKENDVKIYIICSPHNPVGRVWKKEELERIAEITLKYDVLVIADEIHADFIYEENEFVSYASISEEVRQNTILATAPSKTFNTAGLQISPIFIFDQGKRRQFRKTLGAEGYSQIDILALAALRASYTDCDEWVDELVDYIHENILYMEKFIKERLPELKMTHPEGTYLTWVDFSGLGLNDRDLERFIREDAKLWLDAGFIFGKSGEGFERFNLAAPRMIIEDALIRLEKAIAEHRK
jgi:cystathionine beta-lyase